MNMLERLAVPTVYLPKYLVRDNWGVPQLSKDILTFPIFDYKPRRAYEDRANR